MHRKTINFVIAAPWPDGKGTLCVYAWGNEIHCGTIETANAMLAHVKKAEAKSTNVIYPKSEDYDIYVLTKYQEGQ